jgi:hypothetical protein
MIEVVLFIRSEGLIDKSELTVFNHRSRHLKIKSRMNIIFSMITVVH